MKQIKESFFRFLGDKKAKLILIFFFLAGMLLILTPEKREDTVTVQEETAFSVAEEEKRLKAILQTIRGAGTVEVYLSVESTERKVYGQNEKEKWSEGEKTESQAEYTYLDEGNADNALLLQTVYPVYRGAVISAEGAADASICLQLTQAVKAATGLSGDKIQVVIMSKQEESP